MAAVNALFICTANKLRSPTAEQMFASWPGVETDSAGLADYADHVLSLDQIEWADIIFVMERRHLKRLKTLFGSHIATQRVICLDIPDEYELMAPALVALLEKKVGPFLRQ